MKKLFATILLLISAAVYAATFDNFQSLKDAYTSITFIKQASHNGERVVVTKTEGDIQDIIGIQDCSVYFPDRAMDGSDQDRLQTTFEPISAYLIRSGDVNFSEVEYLCWPVWITAIWLDTTNPVAINTATNEPVIIEPNLRCDTSRPFDGGGRTNPEGWADWYFLRNDANNSTTAAKCIQQTGGNITVSYQEPSGPVDANGNPDLSHIGIFYRTTEHNGSTVSWIRLVNIPASSPSGGERIEKRIFVPIVGAAELVAYAYDLEGQQSHPSNMAQINLAVDWQNNTMIARTE